MRSAAFLFGVTLTMAASSVAQAQEPAPYPTLPPLPPSQGQPQPPPPPPGAPPGAVTPPPLGAPPPPPLVAPLRPVPPGMPRAQRAEPVRFEPAEPGVALLARSGTERVFFEHRFRRATYYGYGPAAVYSPMCEGPCSLSLAPGAYDLALAKDGGRAVRPDEPVVIQGPSELRGEYSDNSGLRTAGTVIGLAGLAGGIVMLVVAANQSASVCDPGGGCYSTGGHVDDGLVVGGIATIVGSLVIGSILALQHDSARIIVTPLSLAPPREGANGPVEGAMIGVRF